METEGNYRLVQVTAGSDKYLGYTDQLVPTELRQARLLMTQLTASTDSRGRPVGLTSNTMLLPITAYPGPVNIDVKPDMWLFCDQQVGVLEIAQQLISQAEKMEQRQQAELAGIILAGAMPGRPQ